MVWAAPGVVGPMTAGDVVAPVIAAGIISPDEAAILIGVIEQLRRCMRSMTRAAAWLRVNWRATTDDDEHYVRHSPINESTL